MATFDWLRFCRSHNLYYVTGGPNTKAGNINIPCPWCGAADPSQHLGLSLDIRMPQWGCLRNHEHRGRAPERLIMKLLSIGYEAAHAMVAAGSFAVDDFEEAVAKMNAGPAAPTTREALPTVRPLPDFRDFSGADAYETRFLAYLAEDRGFGVEALPAAQQYGLWYALTGPQRWRIIFPVMDPVDWRLIGWTGRALGKHATLRYKALESMGKNVVLTNRFEFAPKALAIVEGPMDFLKLDYYGRQYGLKVVATMGTAWTEEQLAQLVVLMRGVPRTWVLYDAAAMAEGLALAEELSAHRGRATWRALPAGYEDPGALPPPVAKKFAEELAL